MGLRFAGHPHSLPGWHHEVVAHLHGVPRDFDPIAAGLGLGAKAHGIAVEGRVLHGEDEPSSRRQQSPAGPDKRFDDRHVHEDHVAHQRVEVAFPQCQELFFVGRVDQPVLDVVGEVL